MEITIQQAIKVHKEGRLEEAEKLYRSILKIYPEHFTVMNNLGLILHHHLKFDEAESSFRKAIELKPDYETAYNNLGIIMQNLNRLDEAETSFRKAIELKPDYAGPHNNLGSVLKDLGKPDEAEASYRKAIELKPDYAVAYNNLSSIQQDLGKLNEAEISQRKAIELKPDYEAALNNLDDLLKKKYLLDRIFETKKFIKKNKVNSVDSDVGLTSNPFITHRNVETKLLKDLYKSDLIELDKTKDARYGNGKCSDFKFLKNGFPIIENIKEDLIKIMRSAVKSDVFIFDSFLNIYGPGSGTTPHKHVNIFDENQGLLKQKFSLTYYLSVGDQNCSEPGNLLLYDPSEEIKLSEGTIVIIPATRKHGAFYAGKTDRIMIGINFYSLL
jgi:Flp pilus assembly protein TadD